MRLAALGLRPRTHRSANLGTPTEDAQAVAERAMLQQIYQSQAMPHLQDQMKKARKFHRGAPKPGDTIFFKNRGQSDRGAGRHVGIVERVSNGRVHTIEGNSGNQVRRRSYDLNSPRISNYGRP